MIPASGQFEQLLMESRHDAEVGKEIVESLPFHDGENVIVTKEGVVADREPASEHRLAWEPPRIPLLAGDPDTEFGVLCGHEPGSGTSLPQRLLSLPEDLLIASL